jgi:hypothetical protein
MAVSPYPVRAGIRLSSVPSVPQAKRVVNENRYQVLTNQPEREAV